MQTIIGTDIQIAANLLEKEELVAIPTETVYGLAGNALSEVAVSKIYTAKNRPSFNPLILHVASLHEIEKYAIVDDISFLIASKLMPGPITLLLPKKQTVPDITTAGSNKVAIRIPNHPITLTLLKNLTFPLAAPSANPSGYISPTTAAHVFSGLEGKIQYILNGGATSIGLESTICEIKNNSILLHRAGAISAEELATLTGLEVKNSSAHATIKTPGQLKSHYAPKIPLIVGNIEEEISNHAGKNIAVISFKHNYANYAGVTCYPLSLQGNISEAANQLFATLRLVDTGNFDIIITEIFPNEGIGPAINDRLNRAQFLHK